MENTKDSEVVIRTKICEDGARFIEFGDGRFENWKDGVRTSYGQHQVVKAEPKAGIVEGSLNCIEVTPPLNSRGLVKLVIGLELVQLALTIAYWLTH